MDSPSWIRLPDYAINNVGLGDLRAAPSTTEFQIWNNTQTIDIPYWQEMVAFRVSQVKQPSAYVFTLDYVTFSFSADPSIEGEMRLCQYVSYHTLPGGLWETIVNNVKNIAPPEITIYPVTEQEFCRHSDGMNFAFVDGHVTNYKRQFLGLNPDFAWVEGSGPVHGDIIWNRRDLTIHAWEDN